MAPEQRGDFAAPGASPSFDSSPGSNQNNPTTSSGKDAFLMELGAICALARLLLRSPGGRRSAALPEAFAELAPQLALEASAAKRLAAQSVVALMCRGPSADFCGLFAPSNTPAGQLIFEGRKHGLEIDGLWLDLIEDSSDAWKRFGTTRLPDKIFLQDKHQCLFRSYLPRVTRGARIAFENLDMVAKLKRTSVVISIGGSPDDHHEALHTTVKHDSATQDIYLEMERRRSVVLFHNSALKSAFKAERQSCMGADLSTRSTSSRSSSSRVSDPTRMRRSEAPSADEDTSLHEQGSPLVGDCVPGLVLEKIRQRLCRWSALPWRQHLQRLQIPKNVDLEVELKILSSGR
eukprot:s4_g66.t1